MNDNNEKRQHPRLPVEVEVELHRSGRSMCLVWTDDLSNGGVSLMMNGHGDWPPIGARVQIRVSCPLGGDDESPLVDAIVVRHTEAGIAVRFDETPTRE
ncbi:PilZ domain-containing protein [Allochromatium vinosum]|uniref:Type IV pilus assembly PilZ n=1 Tax=Allochromatium vinosum (strain ATCC 17899 / DSM 180 / NBRC 103801 / NCIMB 10441 / D) TaxID=572477 RepID=D3RTJ3_ALLVD|nr:PilZ domain-containing protein [Allochromatium vinosum]ADC62502.1 type IV pilus assembly PilZ [Allochromatium vinosum DSM 180]